MPQKGEKMKKKIALILTAMLTVSLAGCGGGNDKSSESKKDDTGKKAVSNVKSPDNDMVIAVQTDASGSACFFKRKFQSCYKFYVRDTSCI